jgi:ribosomal protein S18 acetylase RimI-like enzyme
MREQGIEQWDEIYPSESVIARDIAAATLHVLRERTAIIGCLTLDEEFDPLWQVANWNPHGVPATAVHRLMIHPAHQGRGLAKRLMAFAESLARSRGARSVRLDAFTHNPVALALYDRLGYRRAGTATMRKGTFVCFEKLL